MFEFEEDKVSTMLKENFQFKRLYQKHQQLGQEIETAYAQKTEDLVVEKLKKEKLLLRDQLTSMLRENKV